MNCEQARELAALAASGDVTAVERRTLDSHAAICADCREEIFTYEALCGQLATMREVLAPEHAYAVVRARVFGEIDAKRRLWPALAAVLACSVILLVTLRRDVPVTVRTAGQPPVAAQARDETKEIPTPLIHRPSRRNAAKVKAAEPREPLVVKLLTDDPDVVIYWIADPGNRKLNKDIVQ